MNFQKAIYVDLDGTFVPGTEVRNRAALQSMVDAYTDAAQLPSFPIPWDRCNGQDEQRIHAILVESGLDGLTNHVSAEDFQKQAKVAYGQVPDVDYSPRPGMVSTLNYLKHYGVTPVLVTNSPKESAMSVLGEAFEVASTRAGRMMKPEELFPLMVTKSDVLEAGMRPKPSSDPFVFAENELKKSQQRHASPYTPFFLSGMHYSRRTALILEDSGTGTAAGFEFTGDKRQVVQFVDMATPCDMAGHHVQDMTGCVTAMCSFYGIAEPHKTTSAQEALMAMAMRP